MVIIFIITIFLVLSVVGDKLGLRFLLAKIVNGGLEGGFFPPFIFWGFFSCFLGLGWRFKGGLNKDLKTSFWPCGGV